MLLPVWSQTKWYPIFDYVGLQLLCRLFSKWLIMPQNLRKQSNICLCHTFTLVSGLQRYLYSERLKAPKNLAAAALYKKTVDIASGDESSPMA